MTWCQLIHQHVQKWPRSLYVQSELFDSHCLSSSTDGKNYGLSFAQWLQSCPTLWKPMDYSPPGSSVHGIVQVRILEWVAMPSSRGSSRPRDQTHVCLHILHCRWLLYSLSSLGYPSLSIHLAKLTELFFFFLQKSFDPVLLNLLCIKIVQLDLGRKIRCSSNVYMKAIFLNEFLYE